MRCASGEPRPTANMRATRNRGAAILDAHRSDLKAAKIEEGALHDLTWMSPSTTGTLRTPNTMDRAWAKCLEIAGITKRFTLHGLRYTFTDLVRLANVDAVVRRALTGHVTGP